MSKRYIVDRFSTTQEDVRWATRLAGKAGVDLRIDPIQFISPPANAVAMYIEGFPYGGAYYVFPGGKRVPAIKDHQVVFFGPGLDRLVHVLSES